MLSSYIFTDEETKEGMRELFEEFGYTACPHTAIAWLGARSYAKENPHQYASVACRCRRIARKRKISRTFESGF